MHSITLPPQQLHLPSYHPYNQTMHSRRLDYILVKGITAGAGSVIPCRDRASSDHDGVAAPIGTHKGGGPTAPPGALAASAHPTKGEDPHKVLATLAKAITVPGSGHNKFQESAELRGMRRDAQHRPPGPAARTAWKAIAKRHKQEHRAWSTKQAEQAARLDWRSLRTLQKARTHRGWQLQLQDNRDWQTQLHSHMRSIFAKPIPPGGSARITTLRDQLRRKCKHTPWQPFHITELQLASKRWGSYKSTGPDGISHEAAKALLAHDGWGGTITYVMNDMLYTANVPETIDRGITVLLPKVPTPLEWTDTRPITLSSTLLKLAAQLLLARGGANIRGEATLQWARHGRQGVELVATIRRVVQMAKDWGVPTWLVKLDIRKAFDSVWQHSMSELVAARTRTLNVAVGDTITPVPQTNGIRQGLTFSEPWLPETSSPPSRQPPHKAQTRRGGHSLEAELSEDGLHIHPTKTAILFSQPEGGGTFQIGGTTVPCAPYKTVIATLGSPFTFGEQIAAIIAEMSRRGRQAFAKHKNILLARTSIKTRVAAYTTLVRSAALYAAETWPVNQRLLKAANSLQAQHLRRMLHIERRPTEQWADWHVRSLRLARLQTQRGNRWSTYILQQIWSLWGHMARGGEEVNAMIQWKNLDFWRREQRKPRSNRVNHAARFNPEADVERALESVGGTRWGEAAQDRTHWHQLSQTFVDRFDACEKRVEQDHSLHVAGNRQPRQEADDQPQAPPHATGAPIRSFGPHGVAYASTYNPDTDPWAAYQPTTPTMPHPTGGDHNHNQAPQAPQATTPPEQQPADATSSQHDTPPQPPPQPAADPDGQHTTPGGSEQPPTTPPAATAEAATTQQDAQPRLNIKSPFAEVAGSRLPPGGTRAIPGMTMREHYTWITTGEIPASYIERELLPHFTDDGGNTNDQSNTPGGDQHETRSPRRRSSRTTAAAGAQRRAQHRYHEGGGPDRTRNKAEKYRIKRWLKANNLHHTRWGQHLLGQGPSPPPSRHNNSKPTPSAQDDTDPPAHTDWQPPQLSLQERIDYFRMLNPGQPLPPHLQPHQAPAAEEEDDQPADDSTSQPGPTKADTYTPYWHPDAEEDGVIQAAGAQIQMIHEIADGLANRDGEIISNICAIALRMLSHAENYPHTNPRGMGAAFAGPSGVSEAYSFVASMRVRRGENFTPEEYATDLSQLRAMIEAGLGELREPMPGDVPQLSLRKADNQLQEAYRRVDQVILPTMGGGEAMTMEPDTTQAHPADVLNLAGEAQAEWGARTSQTGSATTRILKAATRLRNVVPFVGDHVLLPIVEMLQALERQSLFGGAHAVHESTQTGEPPVVANGETACHNGENENDLDNPEQLRDDSHGGTILTESTEQPAALNAAAMAALMTPSLQAAVNEAGELPTLPTQAESEAETVLWQAPTAGGNDWRAETERGRSRSPRQDDDDGGSHRRRRLQAAHYGRHGPY
ncbi:pol [Symbiodinium sp. CCMP2592]|nr:pol [Symbiodinium sp. CCMP2592]